MIKNKQFLLIVSTFLFSLIYFLTRLQNLTSLPVFGDEAIYIRWSQVMKAVETLRFLPLTDGKQPLFMWLVIPLFKLFKDPLFAGRFLSVLAGFGNLIGIEAIVYLITKGKLKPVFISALLYIFLPFCFFFDRLALADNLLSFFGIWSLFLTLLLARKPRLDVSLILGAILGFAWITKSPAIYFLFLSFFSFFLINYRRIKLIVFPSLSVIIGFFIYNILRLGPQFSQIAIRNRDYVHSFSELRLHPFDPFKPHLFDIFHIYLQYISLPVLLLAIISAVYIFLKTKNHKLNLDFLILFSWWFLPLLANAFIAKTFTARYILYTLPPLIILISLSLSKFKLIFAILPILLIPNCLWLYRISVDPFHARLPSTESGYLVDWTSGWGIKPAADFLIDRSHYANVIAGTEGSFGSLPDGLQIYAENIKHLTVLGTGLGYTLIPEPLLDAKNHGDEVYLLINRSRISLTIEQLSKLSLIKSYDKPDGDKLLLFRI